MDAQHLCGRHQAGCLTSEIAFLGDRDLAVSSKLGLEHPGSCTSSVSASRVVWRILPIWSLILTIL